MNTLNNIVFQIFNRVKPAYVGTQPLSIELIEEYVIEVRANLIKNDLNKNYSVDAFIIQDLGCLELEEADKGCCEYPTGCTILRTKKEIPSTIELHHKMMITRVGPVDITAKPYQIIEFARVPFVGLNKFTKNLVKAFIKDRRIYLVISKDNLQFAGLGVINVQIVAEDPREAASFLTCTGSPCYTDDSFFPVKSWMIPTIIDLVVTKFLGPQTTVAIDTSQDNKVDTKNPQNAA